MNLQRSKVGVCVSAPAGKSGEITILTVCSSCRVLGGAFSLAVGDSCADELHTGVGPTWLAEHKQSNSGSSENQCALMEAEQEVLICVLVCFGSFSLKEIRLTLRP